MERISVKLPFYDLQVVDTNNYVCESGHIHHNSGKTQTLAVRAIGDAAHGAKALVGVYAPTYDLLKLVNMARVDLLLHEFGIRHKLHTQDKAIYTSHPGMGDFIFRTMDAPERIVGYETFRAHADELDTLKTDHARQAWQQIIARNRQQIAGGHANQARAYTTPEGFRFTHERWVANATPDYQIFRAPTYSNPFLPSDYIDGLRASYPAQLIDAYIEGKFVNLTSGTVYSSYERTRCGSREKIRPGEMLFIGQDFNVGQMASVVLVRRPNGLHAVDEIMGGLDTPWLIRTLVERYPGHKMCIYPDASGKSRKTVDASKSDLTLLRSSGFRVVVDARNPAVRDRIVAVNQGFESARLWVNSAACPVLARSLEQQAYAPNGEPDKDGGHDHANDALGYPVVKEMPVRMRDAPRDDTEEPRQRGADYGVDDDEEEGAEAWKIA